MSKRKYNPEYLKYGFISIEHRGEVLPQCVVCMKTLSNASMKPSLLQRHLGTNHADKKNQDQSYFQRLEREAAALGQNWPIPPEGGRDCLSIV